MDTATGTSGPLLWTAHPNFASAVNRNIIQAEVEGGVRLRELPPRTMLAMETRNRIYTLEILDDRRARISGHPEFCAEPTEITIHGSTWGGSMIWGGFIGRGMFLEFHHPAHGIIRTTRIVEIRAES